MNLSERKKETISISVEIKGMKKINILIGKLKEANALADALASKIEMLETDI